MLYKHALSVEIKVRLLGIGTVFYSALDVKALAPETMG